MRDFRPVYLILLSLLLLLLTACAPKAMPAPTPATPAAVPEAAPSAASVTATESWEKVLERVVQAAQKEGTVVVYAAVGQVRAPLIEAFGRRYGIKAEFIVGRMVENTTKIVSERRAGIYLADVVLGGGIVETLKPHGVLEPLEPVLILPELTDPETVKKTWWQGKLLWCDKDHTVLAAFAYPQPPMVVNTGLVKGGEIQSYDDLLNPKWEGKIAIDDPTVSGPGSKWFAAAAYKIKGTDFMRQLAKQKPIIIRDRRLYMEWLAHGKVAIVLGPSSATVQEFVDAGAPIKYVIPKEGAHLTSGGGNVSLLTRAPHPNAAKLFVNWILSQEGQTVFAKAYGVQSARLDVPTDFLLPEKIRDPNREDFFTEYEEFLLKVIPEMTKLAKEVFDVR